MEPFTPFKPEDLELIQKYDKLSLNFKRLLSQIFTQVAIDYKILVGRPQQQGAYTGWHFKMGERKCWFGVCFKDQDFLGTRFRVNMDGVKPEFKEAVKSKGYEEVAWDKASWMSQDQPTQALKTQDRLKQVEVFRNVADRHLSMLSVVEAQMGASGGIPLTSI